MPFNRPRLILVGGLPGSGKTHVGRRIAGGSAVFLDKDTVSRFFAEALLVHLGSSKNDRESRIYLDQVKPYEYNTLMKLAQENLDLGNSVVCSAPFLDEFCDREWVEKTELLADIADAALIFVWITSDEKTTRKRIINRNAGRDEWKLANWAAWYAAAPKQAPQLPALIAIDNSENGMDTLNEQVASVLMEIEKRD